MLVKVGGIVMRLFRVGLRKVIMCMRCLRVVIVCVCWIWCCGDGLRFDVIFGCDLLGG